MVRLPTRDDLAGLPSARSGRVVANYDTSAAGRGLADLGASIAGAATDIGRMGGVSGSGGARGPRVSQAEQFEAQRKFLEFQSAQEQAYEESKSTVDPGAFGFREKAQQNYLNAAKEFFTSIPDALKPEYDMKLFQTEDALLSRSRAFETTERTRYYGEEVNKGLGTLENNLFSNPGNFDKNFSEGASFINAIPDESLSRIQKADLVKQWRTKAQLASLNGVTPQERIRLLGGAPNQAEAAPSASRGQAVTRGMPGEIRSVISEAAARHGVDPNALLTIAWIESKGDPNAKNPNSSAGGLFQFIDSTARGYGLSNKFDPAQAADAAARLARDNSTALEGVLGRKPTAGELYLAHQQGIGGATKLLSNPNARAADLVGADAVRLNGGSADMTAGQFASLWMKKAGDTHVPDGGFMGAQYDASRADPRFADMNYADAQKIISGAQGEISDALKQAESLRREAAIQTQGMIETAIQNAPVAVLNTGGYDGQIPDRQQFIEAYGAQEGSERFAKFSSAMDVSKQAFDFRTMPADEIQAAVDQAQPTSTGNNAALETARHETLTKAAQETIKARNADPSAYVQQTFPSVAQAWEEAETSGDYRTALAATASAQRQLGIQDMRLLPKQTAAQTITSFKDENATGEQRIGAVTGMIFSTGDPAQRRAIFDQLVEAGLPDATEGAIEAYARGDEGAGRRLMEAAIIDPSKLPGTTNLKPADIDAEIQAKIMDEGQVGDIFYGLSDGTIENQERAIRDSKLLTNAVSLRVRNGETLEAAIDGAAKDLYGDLQAVTGGPDVNAQILVPSNVDPSPILAGLAGLLPTIRTRLEGSMVVPAEVAAQSGEKAVTEAVRTNYIDNVMAEGYFRNSGDGYVFIDPYVGAAIADKAGKPIIFSEDDVRAAPVKEKASPDFVDVPQTRIQTPEEVQQSEYGKFAPLLNESKQDAEPEPEGPNLGGGGGY